jgi:hypothetical protein
LLSRALGAHASLLRGDTTIAIDEMKALSSTARRDSVEWFAGESLPVTRLVLAELLLATGRYEEALIAASVFDHQSPVAFYPFFSRSLALRHSAARLLNRPRLIRRYRDRLERLGRLDLLDGRS